ncbi:MAG: class I SAM-dependent methyltransferase [Candidatus Aminicenantales bacterium]
MEKEEYQKHYALEESFWWFRGRRDIILGVLESFAITRSRQKILDAGCGTGFNLNFFENFGNSFGCDFSEDALFFCRKRGLKKVARGDVQKLPFKSRSFSLVALLDVLYHKNVRDDTRVLQEVHRVLKNGGYLLITDSAFNFLRSKHDLAFHTRERYTKKTLLQRLEQAGFGVLKMSYFNFFLFFFVFLSRRLTKILPGQNPIARSDLKAIDPRLNNWLYHILKCEAVLTRYLSLPFGSSILCFARKK